jgi:putative hydrolase of the HAD superfamily
VGDLPYTDVRAAQAAGLRAVWLNRAGTGLGANLPEVTSLTEIPGHIAQIERDERTR